MTLLEGVYWTVCRWVQEAPLPEHLRRDIAGSYWIRGRSKDTRLYLDNLKKVSVIEMDFNGATLITFKYPSRHHGSFNSYITFQLNSLSNLI